MHFHAYVSDAVAGAIIIALVYKTKKDARLQAVVAITVGVQITILSTNLRELALNLLAVVVASGSSTIHFGTDCDRHGITARIA